MSRHPEKSRQKGWSGVSTCSIGKVSSHSFMRRRLWFWTMVMRHSSESSESALASQMNIGSGSMTICWLSSLPVLVSGGRERASAAVWFFPGT
jgi:hypothetical protein